MTRACVVLLSRPVTDTERWEFLLDHEERARAARFRREADRARFVTGRAVAKTELAHRLGTAPHEVRFDVHCAHCDSTEHGKPTVPGDARFSIAHSGSLVAVALCDGAPVGVDVELIGERGGIGSLAASVLSADELAVFEGLPAPRRTTGFYTYWARKEALVKSTGQGLSAGLRSVSVTGPDEPPAVTAWPSPDAAALHDLDLDGYTADDDYRGAVAVLTAEPVHVRYQHWSG